MKHFDLAVALGAVLSVTTCFPHGRALVVADTELTGISVEDRAQIDANTVLLRTAQDACASKRAALAAGKRDVQLAVLTISKNKNHVGHRRPEVPSGPGDGQRGHDVAGQKGPRGREHRARSIGRCPEIPRGQTRLLGSDGRGRRGQYRGCRDDRRAHQVRGIGEVKKVARIPRCSLSSSPRSPRPRRLSPKCKCQRPNPKPPWKMYGPESWPPKMLSKPARQTSAPQVP